MTGTAVSVFAARAGDRNPRAMRGALELGDRIAQAFDLQTTVVAEPDAVADGGWAAQLRLAAPKLSGLAAHLDGVLKEQRKSLLVTTRCAASIATLPVVAKRHPDICVVWFDAHGDCNTPADQNYAEHAYLGGMVLSGAAGEWDTGFGAGLNLAQVVLVGSRDLDPPEIAKIRAGCIQLIGPGERLGEKLAAAVKGRPVYVHLDCDVLSAGLVPTEYQVENGLSFADLKDACDALSRCTVLGLEIAEYEGAWPDGRLGNSGALLDAVAPLIHALVT